MVISNEVVLFVQELLSGAPRKRESSVVQAEVLARMDTALCLQQWFSMTDGCVCGGGVHGTIHTTKATIEISIFFKSREFIAWLLKNRGTAILGYSGTTGLQS